MYVIFIDISDNSKITSALADINDEDVNIIYYISKDCNINYLHEDENYQSIILNFINEFEESVNAYITKAVLILADDLFKVRKLSINHSMPFDKKIEDEDIFSFYKQAWKTFKEKYPNENLVDIRSSHLIDDKVKYKQSYIKGKVNGTYLLTSANNIVSDYVKSIENKANIEIVKIMPKLASSIYGVQNIRYTKHIFIDIDYNSSTIISIDQQEVNKICTLNDLCIKNIVMEVQKTFNLNEQKSFNLLKIYLDNYGSVDHLNNEFQKIQKSKLNLLIINQFESLMASIVKKIQSHIEDKEEYKLIFTGLLSNFEYTRSVAKNIMKININLSNLDKTLDINNNCITEYVRYVKYMNKMSKYSKKLKGVIHNALRFLAVKIDNII